MQAVQQVSGEGYILSEWKLANVVPVYKKDETDHVENYRPISLLCIISKVLKRCVLNRIHDRLEDLSARVPEWTFMCHKSTRDPRLHWCYS